MSTPVWQTPEQQGTCLVAAMDHSGCSGLAQVLVSAGIGTHVAGLDAGIAGLLEPSCIQVIFLYAPPETAVAHGLTEGLEPSGFLEQWVAQHQTLLGHLKRHRGRWVLLDASAAGVDPGAAISAIGAPPPAQALSPVVTTPMALERLLTAGAAQAAPDIQRIAAHLAALSTPVNADQAAPSAPADPISNYLDLQAELRLQTDARQRSESEALKAQTRSEKARTEAEALAAARQAQIEQLNAARAITEQQLTDRQAQLDETTRAKTDAEALAHARQAEIAQLSAAKAAADTLAAARQGQLDEAAKARETQRAEVADLKSENELLLLQLHQVQEELESWFLKSKAGEEELSSAKQAAQDAEALAHARQAEIEQANAAKAAAEKIASERQTQIEQANAAKAAAEKVAAERQSQLDEAAKARETQRAEVAELKSENELLLLQLHQVQEELEAWFLKAKDLGEELQQAKQSGKAALEEVKTRLDQARQNKDIAEKLARERYDALQEVRREKRRLEKALLPPPEMSAAQPIPAPEPPTMDSHDGPVGSSQTPPHAKLPIDPAKIPVLRAEPSDDQAPAAAPNPVKGPGGLFQRKRRIKGLKKKDVALVRTSELFDAQWYLQTNTDVAEEGFDPVEHYLAFGFAERRNPSLRFDASFYLERNPDVSMAGNNPLLHYLKFGKAEGRAIRVADTG